MKITVLSELLWNHVIFGINANGKPKFYWFVASNFLGI